LVGVADWFAALIAVRASASVLVHASE